MQIWCLRVLTELRDDIVLQPARGGWQDCGGNLYGRRLRHLTGFRGYHAGSGHRKDQGRGHAPGGSVFRMIKGTVSDEELEELEEASALVDISTCRRVSKCAVLGWHTLMEMLGDEPEEK